MADMSYQVFVALDGTALEGGSIFLGVANDDPEQNPIPVYWDEELTVLADQPLRTSGGVIVRDGTPADVYAAVTAYSIRVRDRAGQVVWYKPTTGGNGASRLTFPIPAGPPGADSTVPGPANNTYTSYSALLASDPTRQYAYLVGDTDTPAQPDGVFSNPTKTTGAWVRQKADGLSVVPLGQPDPTNQKAFNDRLGYWASTAAEIQAANDAIVASGKRQTINLVPKLAIPLSTGLTIDVSLVSFSANGSYLDASAMTTGSALTLTGSIDPPYRQNMIELRLPEVRGPLSSDTAGNNFAALNVDGVTLASTASSGQGFGPSHVTLTGLNVSGFRNGLALGNRAYLVRLERPDIHRCNVCVWQASSPDGQENNRISGGVLYNSDWAVKVSDDRADLALDGTSIDSVGRIADIEAGELYLNGCHVEVVGATTYADVPFMLRSANSRVYWNGGSRRVPAGTKTFDVWADLAAGSIFVDRCNSAQGDISATGAFARGAGTYIAPRGSGGPEVRNNCYVAHQDRSRVPDINYQFGRNGAFIIRTGEGYTQPDRYTELQGSNPSTALTLDGTRLKYTKSQGVGGPSAACILMIPAEQMDLIGGRIYYEKPGAQSGTLFLSAVWGWLDPLASGPIPNIIRTSPYATASIVIPSAPVTLTQATFSPFSSHRAPPGANVWMLNVNASSMAAGDLFFSLPSFDRVG